MKAIVNTAPGQVQLCDWPTPQPADGQVLIRSGATGICATDLEMIAGWSRTRCPAIPGHEWSGTVEALGRGVDQGLLGRRCVAENVLSDGGEVGFEHAGGYGEYFVTDARNVQVLPDDFPFATAALIEPLAVSLRALRRLHLRDKRSGLIFGDGPIGLLMVALLRQAGVQKLTLIGGRARRLSVAKALGADLAINRHEVADLAAAARDACPNCANMIEASGAADALKLAMDIAAGECKILLIGDYLGARADFEWNRILHRELELIGSNASGGAWPEAVRLATQNLVPLQTLITHVLPFSRFAEGLDLLRSKSPDAIKVVLTWE